MKLSGIGGQAVIEGIMMRNKDRYSVAVRKPDNQIEVITKECSPMSKRNKICQLPVIRGVVSFVDSLVVGISTLTYSSGFYEDPQEQQPTKVDNVAKAIFKEKLDSVIMAVTVLCSVALAVVLFMVAPYYISRLLSKFIVSQWVLNLIEGLVRVLIFIMYILLISLMPDIRRTFMYHGAEHKCINCIEHGMALTVENVRGASREHKRCGTSFLFVVMFISVIFFIFIKLSNPVLQVLVRLLLVPVIAGVSYEVILWAGKSDSKAVMIVSKPGMLLQRLTTREPDDSMIEVGIKAVEAVFDWRTFLDEYYEDVPDEDIPEEAYYYEEEIDEYSEDYAEYDNEESGDWDYIEDKDSEEEASDDDYAPEEEEPDDGDAPEEEEPDDGDASEEEEPDDDDAAQEEEPDDGDAAEEEEPDDDYASEEEEPNDGDASQEDEYEEPEDSEDANQGDGIEFIDEESVEDDDIGIDVPIFKQRRTDVEKYDKKR